MRDATTAGNIVGMSTAASGAPTEGSTSNAAIGTIDVARPTIAGANIGRGAVTGAIEHSRHPGVANGFGAMSAR